ncbi:DNA repair protein RecO [Aliidiomarina sanyensis]|uniref:DNA repair protein RecO n=1 Tax=Aliidiomarina sanyensis TaxID=1249555 RepID=A0A432WRB4_9GAMM|nr:DNA repair protein RecO [Aliidiomarina sanyensis]RUO36346.1 DNA repair protein RecO [Aliidiomarina sanyensis]
MQQAFVLHRWPYQEHGLLIDLLLSNDTRIRAISKYARSRRSKIRGSFEPFQTLDLELIGRGDLKVVRTVEVTQRFSLAGDRVYSGLYVNEITQRLLREHIEAEGVYGAYAQTLSLLADGVDPHFVLRRFEWQLLDALDLLDSFTHEARAGDPIDPERNYTYVPGTGFLEVAPGQRESNALAGESILKMAQFTVDDPLVMRQFRSILRRALVPHLGDKPLKSRELLLASRATQSRILEEKDASDTR